MKRCFGWVLAVPVLLSFAAGPAARGQDAAAPADAEREADHAALRALRDKVVDALSNQNIPALCEAVAAEFAYTAIDQSVITTRNGISNYIARVFQGPNAPVAKLKIEVVADIKTRFVAEDVGYCYGRALEHYVMRDGSRMTVPSRWTALCVKEGGLWRVATLQSGVNVLSNPVLARAVSLGNRKAVVTLIAGVLLGIALELILRRACSRGKR